MTAHALIHSDNIPRRVDQCGDASQQSCGRHHAGKNRDQISPSLDASDNSDQSISDIFHWPKVRCEKFRHADAIEKLLAHFQYSPSFWLRNIQSIFVQLATLNSLFGCLLRVGKMAYVTTASQSKSCERLASLNSRRREARAA
jgi:hypothetical protein